jgi:signal transduction histidine kinase
VADAMARHGGFHQASVGVNRHCGGIHHLRTGYFPIPDIVLQPENHGFFSARRKASTVMGTYNTIANAPPLLRSESQARQPPESEEINKVGGHEIRNALGRPSAIPPPIELNQELCRFDNLVGKVLNEVSARNSDRSIRLRHVMNGCDPQCEVDPARMRQAIRYLVEISLESCPRMLKIGLLFFDAEIKGQSALEIIYRDNATRPVMNQHDRRLARSLTAHKGGTNLELTIVRGIVEAHGGQIVVRYRATGGVEFVIRLPRCQGPYGLDDAARL